MTRVRKVRIGFYVIYLLIVIAGAVLVYKFLPAELRDLLWQTYSGKNVDGF